MVASIELVRELLRKDKVQLWLPPYTPDTDGQALASLASSYAERLQGLQATGGSAGSQSEATGEAAGPTEIQVFLTELRDHALAKLRAKTRITLVGRVLGEKRETLRGLDGNGELRLGLDSAQIGQEVRLRICRELGVEKVKVIASGRALQDEGSLQEQGWLCDKDRGEQPIRVLLMASGIFEESPELANASSGSHDSGQVASNGGEVIVPTSKELPIPMVVDSPPPCSVARMSEAAAMLTAEGFGDFELADAATGRLVPVPHGARQALVTAVALHAKGREILRDGQKSAMEALEFLVEADQCFERCRDGGAGQLLEQLENFGQLQLDICWAYTLSGNTDSLPDAEARLEVAERFIRRHVDKNFLTLAEVKADQGCTLPPEVVPATRLWLLRGIARRCRNDPRASDDIDRARIFLRGLHVEESSVEGLLTMGATRKQAVAALRRCGGQADRAAESILAAKPQSQAAQRLREEQRKLGVTADGSYVDPDRFAQLLGQLAPLDVDRDTALRALKEANNDLGVALDVAQRTHTANQPVDDIALCSLLSLGFASGPAEAALRATGGNNVEEALLRLTAYQATPEAERTEDTMEVEQAPAEDPPAAAAIAGAIAGGGALCDVTPAEGAPSEKIRQAEERKAAQAAAKKAALDEARELVEREFGQCLRRTDADDDVAGATFEEEELLLQQCLSEF